MKEKTDKILTISMLALAVVTTVLVVLFAFAKAELPNDEVKKGITNPDVKEYVEKVTENDIKDVDNTSLLDVFESNYPYFIGGNGLYNTFFVILSIIIGVSLLAMLTFWVLGQVDKFMSDKKYWIKFLVVLAICAVVVIMSFLLSSGNDIAPEFLEKFEITPGVSRLIGAACILSYILAAGAIVSILCTEVVKIIKKK